MPTSGAPPQAGEQNASRPRLKRALACDYCRSKKIRCNFDNRDSCTNCLDKRLTCSKPRPSRKSKLHNATDENEGIMRKVVRVEELLQQLPQPYRDAMARHTATTPSLHPLNSTLFDSGRDGSNWLADTTPGFDATQLLLQSPSQTSGLLANPIAHQGDMDISSFGPSKSSPLNAEPESEILETSSLAQPHSTPFVAKTTFPAYQAGSPQATRSTATSLGVDNLHNGPEENIEQSSVPSSELSNYEYSGPRSFISICSKPGIQWVIKQTSSVSFSDAAKTFTSDTTMRLKLQRRLPRDTTPDPDHETAWAYTKAYFDEAIDAALAIVHRPWFEAQLVAFYNGSKKDDDVAWYALRNAILASGCRIVLSRSKSFHDANQAAWQYFGNALSVHTEVLFFRASIIGVQALTVMAYYTSNIGSPCLEYMLCNNALRLAVAQGLHRQTVSSLHLSDHEITQRQCIFWAAYCLEKQIVCQSGRPSICDDNDVNVAVPTAVSPGSTLNLQFCTTLIKFAHLSSLVSKRLSGAHTLKLGLEYWVKAVLELDEQLNGIRLTIDPAFSLNSRANLGCVPPEMTSKQALYLRFVLFSVTLDIHTALMHPWSRNMPGHSPRNELRPQIEKSYQIVAETCRSAIQCLGYIRFDASTPISMSFHGPMYALINLFICILQYPNDPKVPSDLNLMDVGAGHFAWIQSATDSEVCVPFAKEIATLAHATARKHQTTRNAFMSTNESNSVPSPCAPAAGSSDADVWRALYGLQTNESDHISVSPPFDYGLEDWSLFLPNGFESSH